MNKTNPNPNLIKIIDNSEFNLLLESLIKQNEDMGKPIKYAGLGLPNTPISIIKRMSHIAKRLEHQWFVLYNGGEVGPETAFLAGTQFFKVFLPNKFYNFRTSNRIDIIDSTTINSWNEIVQKTSSVGFNKKLLARYNYVILDENLNSPVDFVICWGEDFYPIQLAKQHNIPVFNLANNNVLEDVLKALKFVF